VVAIESIVALLVVLGGGLGGGSLFTVGVWIVGLLAMIGLWREESSLYFAESRYWGTRRVTPW
jgi:hypothetical protein